MTGVDPAMKPEGKRPLLSHYPRNLEAMQGVELLAQHFVAVDLQQQFELLALLHQNYQNKFNINNLSINIASVDGLLARC